VAYTGHIIAPGLERTLATLPIHQGWTLVPMVEIQRGERGVVVFWPAIDPNGDIAPPNMFAAAFDHVGGEGYRLVGERWAIRDHQQGQESIANILGGSDFIVRPRNEGVPLETLGPALVERFQMFADAARIGDRSRAVEAGVAFSRLLHFDRVAYENSAALLLWNAGRYTLDYQTFSHEEPYARVMIDLMSGTTQARRLNVLCTPTDGARNHWVVVNPE